MPVHRGALWAGQVLGWTLKAWAWRVAALCIVPCPCNVLALHYDTIASSFVARTFGSIGTTQVLWDCRLRQFDPVFSVSVDFCHQVQSFFSPSVFQPRNRVEDALSCFNSPFRLNIKLQDSFLPGGHKKDKRSQ